MKLRKALWTGLLLLLLISTSLIGYAQDDLTEIYVSEDETFAFSYPAGWTVNDEDPDFPQLIADDASLAIAFYGPSFIVQAAPDASNAVELIETVQSFFEMITGSPDATQIGGRDAALAEVSGDFDGVALAVELSDGGYGLMITFIFQGEISDHADNIVAIVETFDTPNASNTDGSTGGGSDSTPPDSSDYPLILSDHAETWQEAIAELEDEGIISSGGSLVFNENNAFFSGQGAFFTPLARRSPFTDVVMAAELNYTVGGTAEFETCTIMARIVTNSQGTATEYLEVGLDNSNELFFRDVVGGSGDNNVGVFDLGLDYDNPQHILFIAKDDLIIIYLNGELIVADEEIEDRSGTYGIALRGTGRDARCEGNNIWVYQSPSVQPGVCEIQAANTVNKRSGPGTNFDRAGQMGAGTTTRAQGQATDTAGFTWWQMDDDDWVREDVVSAVGDCNSLPESAPSGTSNSGSTDGSSNTSDNENTGNNTASADPTQSALARPDNCAQAVEWGYTAEQAAKWPHLDRDNDGVACYGT